MMRKNYLSATAILFFVDLLCTKSFARSEYTLNYVNKQQTDAFQLSKNSDLVSSSGIHFNKTFSLLFEEEKMIQPCYVYFEVLK